MPTSVTIGRYAWFSKDPLELKNPEDVLRDFLRHTESIHAISCAVRLPNGLMSVMPVAGSMLIEC